MTPNMVQFSDDLLKISTKNLLTQETIHFSENPQKYRNSKF